jgi:hypothetical protein
MEVTIEQIQADPGRSRRMEVTIQQSSKANKD